MYTNIEKVYDHYFGHILVSKWLEMVFKFFINSNEGKYLILQII
jgi:hypothetical protein